MPRPLKPVELGFIETAPYRCISTEVLHHPAEAIFQAVAEDAAGWGSWFPGFSHKGRYLTAPPHGVGSQREVWAMGVHFAETILAWEPPNRWAFTVTEANAPIANSLAESYQITPHGPYTLVQWTFAIYPKPAIEWLLPIGDHLLPMMFRRAMTNLSAHLAGNR
jgi:hypothetical protein